MQEEGEEETPVAADGSQGSGEEAGHEAGAVAGDEAGAGAGDENALEGADAQNEEPETTPTMMQKPAAAKKKMSKKDFPPKECHCSVLKFLRLAKTQISFKAIKYLQAVIGLCIHPRRKKIKN